ncbi:DUF2971 domain-containing protein [Duganella sp. P38]|uniref:DUF2971 domain-containing protein n=1 Tax=Duganella sp. P38 TaxID=3423949 RepID=UPI003D7B2E4F
MNASPSRLAFKYRTGDATTLDRDLQGLRESTFYAAQRSTLNDPFEGRFDRSSLDSQLDGIRTALPSISAAAAQSFDKVLMALDQILGFVDKYGVFSLSYTPLSELIWSHYGGSHHGFCVGYDIQKLTEFEPNLHTYIDVKYSDSAPSFQTGYFFESPSTAETLQRILGIKSTAWSYEQEVRVITTPPGLHEYDFRAVRKVYFGLRCPETTRFAVMEALAGRGVAYEQIESPGSSYLLRSAPIKDLFADVSSYKENLAPIIDGAISLDHLKPEYKQYHTHLQKAAEIVRREPYCMEIQQVDISASKSTPGNPIIFVQYLRSKNKWVNHYLSLLEVETQYDALPLKSVLA